MERFRLTPHFIFLLLCMIICMSFPAIGQADSAKQKYMAADDCFKKLRHSSTQQQKVSGWLNCIRRYETIYKIYPKSSWAPAGMYKAAELSLQLFNRSKDRTHKSRAIDLLTRIRNKYPKSAYSGRAKILLKSIAATPVRRHIKHLRSKKEKTRNDVRIEQFNREQASLDLEKLIQAAEEKDTEEKQAPDTQLAKPERPLPRGVTPW